LPTFKGSEHKLFMGFYWQQKGQRMACKYILKKEMNPEKKGSWKILFAL